MSKRSIIATNPLFAPLSNRGFLLWKSLAGKNNLFFKQDNLTFSAVIVLPSTVYDTTAINMAIFVENFPNDNSNPRT
jgi:hypothetical protein